MRRNGLVVIWNVLAAATVALPAIGPIEAAAAGDPDRKRAELTILREQI